MIPSTLYHVVIQVVRCMIHVLRRCAVFEIVDVVVKAIAVYVIATVSVRFGSIKRFKNKLMDKQVFNFSRYYLFSAKTNSLIARQIQVCAHCFTVFFDNSRFKNLKRCPVFSKKFRNHARILPVCNWAVNNFSL